MSALTTAAVLLRSHDYSETSRVLRFYTESMGVMGVMAKGVRKRGGKGGTGLETFAGGELTAWVKPTRDLQTLKDFQSLRPRRGLAADPARFAGASVLAELVLRHAGEESNPPLFRTLEEGLDRVEAAPPEGVLAEVLARGWLTVSVLGYQPAVEHCPRCGRALGADEVGRFDFSAGGVRCPRCTEAAGADAGPRLGPRARAQLSALLAGEVPDPLERPRAHLRLLSDFVTYHVSGSRPLRSIPVLAGLAGR